MVSATTDTATPVERTIGSRLPSLTGMRWIAVLLVFIYHSTGGIFPVEPWGHFVTSVTGKMGWMGVSFFFILSGFVLTWSARIDDTPRRFWRRRFFKIYPNHFAAFLLAAGLMAWTGTQIQYVVPNLFLIQSWSPNPPTFMSVNGVSWSLSCEAFFYLSFPLLIHLVRMIKPHHLWYWAGAVVLTILAMPVVAAPFLPDAPQLAWEPHPQYEFWFVYIFPPVRMLEFALGILLAQIVLENRWIDIKLPTAIVACIAGYTASLHVPYLYQFVAATVVPLALLIGAGAMADIRGRSALLGAPAMVWLGNISFAFYLVHRLILAHLVYLAGEDQRWTGWSAFGLVALGFVLTVLLAAALYVLIERPVQRRFAVRRRPAVTPAPAPAV